MKNKILISTIIAVAAFLLPSFARGMFQKGIIPENVAVTITMLGMPVAFFAIVFALSCTAASLFKRK